MSASKWGQGNLSGSLPGPASPGPNQQTVGTNPIVWYLNLEDFDVASLQLIIEDGNVQGAWTFDGSNDYNDLSWGGTAAVAGHWTPITPAAFPSELFPALVAVTTVYPAASGNQCIRSGTKLGWRTLRITFTPTSGASHISVYAFAKASN